MESNRTYAIFDETYMRSNLRNYKAIGPQDEAPDGPASAPR